MELRLGDNSQIADEIKGFVATNPTRERLTEQLMVALHRSGRTAEALQHYEKWRRWLREELGIDPGAAVQQAHIAILQSNHTVSTGGASARPKGTSGGPSAEQRPENLPAPTTDRFIAAVPRILLPDVADFT